MNLDNGKIKLLGESEKSGADSRRFLFTCIFLVLWFAALVFVNNATFIYVDVVGSSMEKTLHTGDVLFANVHVKPSRGDIILIEGESKNGLIIKRAIAFGGDSVEIKNGEVYVNGEKLDEPYVASFDKNENRETKLIPEGEIFYLGDNRKVSMDSRSEFGTAKENQIVGVVPRIALKLRKLTALRVRISSFLRGLTGA